LPNRQVALVFILLIKKKKKKKKSHIQEKWNVSIKKICLKMFMKLFFAVLRIELRGLHMLCKFFTTELHPWPQTS
jgi:hypothetical protein